MLDKIINWWKNPPQGFEFAYVDALPKEEEKEEDSLIITVLNFRIGRFFRNIITFGESGRQERRAEEAARAAAAEANRANAAFKTEAERITKEIGEAQSTYDTVKAEQEAQSVKSEAAYKAAELSRQEAETVGARTESYAKGKEAEAKTAEANELARLKSQQAKDALMEKRLARQPKGPSPSFTVVKGPGVGGTGKPGSTTKSAKELRDKKKTGLTIG
jgi:membrane protein involved in colicin uptake